MLEIKAKLKIARGAYRIDVRGRVGLTFEQRSRFPARARLESGEEVNVALAPGEVLRGGDLATASDGRVFEIVAQEEDLLHVEMAAVELTRLAYRLGSRHVPAEVGAGHLRIAASDSAALEADGVQARPVRAPFEPEFEPHAAHEHDGHCDHDHHGHPHHHHDHR
ncbi:MAG TPA: urease accessory protein UreE [Burkholderiales bacterium]|nr:urease accessory protein UreE [Burkholderiales bacterium]